MGSQCSSDVQGCRDRAGIACCRRDPGDPLEDFSGSQLRRHAGLDEWEAGDQDDGPGAARETLEDPSRADTAPPLPRETSGFGNDDCPTGIPEMVPEPPEMAGRKVSESSKQSAQKKETTIPKLDLKNVDSADVPKAAKAKETQQAALPAAAVNTAQAKQAAQPAAAVAKPKAKVKAKAKTAAAKAKPKEAARSASIPQWIQALAGLWLDAKDLNPMATLQEGKVFWFRYAGHPPAALKVLSDNSFCMATNGKDNLAKLLPGSPPQLQWDDGSTWIREELQGTWKNFDEDRIIGQIMDGRIIWDPVFATPTPTALSPVPPLPQATIQMELCGEMCSGVFHAGLPAILKWSDGETWTRVGMSR